MLVSSQKWEEALQGTASFNGMCNLLPDFKELFFENIIIKWRFLWIFLGIYNIELENDPETFFNISIFTLQIIHNILYIFKNIWLYWGIINMQYIAKLCLKFTIWSIGNMNLFFKELSQSWQWTCPLSPPQKSSRLFQILPLLNLSFPFPCTHWCAPYIIDSFCFWSFN